MQKPTPLSESDLKALVQAELRSAVGFYGGKLAEQRRKAEVYYYGEATGDLAAPEIEGRSDVVVPRVRNTILSVIPPLMVKFCGGDSVVEFEASKPGDEQAATNATDYCNYVFFKQNTGHQIVRAWFTDALKYKLGVIKVWWDERKDETREEYKGLTQVELQQIADDEEVEITEQSSYPDEEDAEQRQKAIEQLTQQCQQAEQAAKQGNQQAAQACQQMQAQIAQMQSMPPAMLFDIVCKRTKKGGKVTIENVPPEEFGFNREAKSVKDARFLRHSVLRTMSDLRTMGYDEAKLQAIGAADENSLSWNMERVERNAFDDEMAGSGLMNETADASQIKVWVHECYIRCDADGDGISELRKVTLAGGEVLSDEIVDVAPFVTICPVPEPHKLVGLSLADLSMTGQRVETELLRGIIDNNRIQVNGRYFAVEGQVNLDDLLMSRPGGVVRVKSENAVGRLEQGLGDIAGSMEMLSYMEKFAEDSTGYSPTSQSFDTTALDGSETATKTRIVSNKASMRTDDIARNFADGFVELFRMILKLVCQNQNKAQAIKLAGQWVDMDPREWRNQFDVAISVGLGVGDKDQAVSHLTMLMQTQGHAMQIGAANPLNVYNAAAELAKALGYRNADKFFTKPDPNQPPPNPMQGQMQIEQMKAQSAQQTAQMQAQFEAQKHQMELQQNGQIEQMKAQMQAQVDDNRQRAEAEQQQLKLQQEAQLEQLRAHYENERHQREQEQALEIAKVKARAQIISARISANAAETPDEMNAEGQLMSDGPSPIEVLANTLGTAVGGLQGAVHALHEHMARPKQIVRDGNGRAVGIQ